ncbi:predicted protein [Pyrenophora tritici-repentis Pt-1C-BFP]|uniref:Uncharacterized protein n=1 Tax=Pyrenophora tritici-repentis (strain Pt-1C-BFP) TaxID=426418 RepID=B2W101_PYRTR|nr:uncharacterized protein PTRG_04136 [Pyrenophora tritici-repentis Pt-1C-BFP]EDU46974.1 predicted protein [Pyrenophora tritici-repentis Pt-1C-BFP]
MFTRRQAKLESDVAVYERLYDKARVMLASSTKNLGAVHGSLGGDVAMTVAKEESVRCICGEGNDGPHLYLGPALDCALIALILTESRGTGAIRAEIRQILGDLVNREGVEGS